MAKHNPSTEPLEKKGTSILTRVKNVMLQPLIALIIGLAIGAVVIVLAGEDPISVYAFMFQKSFFEPFYLFQTLTRSIPIMLCAIATASAWRAGYINLGMEGQMIVGALVATVVGLNLQAPGIVVILVAMVAGMGAAALYALFAAWIFKRFNVSIVISTLMMNYIAGNISSYIVTFPLKDPKAIGVQVQSALINKDYWLPRVVQGNTFHYGFFIAVAVILLYWFMMKKSLFGYESKMTGFNQHFAGYGGVNKGKLILQTMALSGAIAGLAGVIEVFGVTHRFVDGTFVSTGYAWSGLMTALISGLNAFGAFFVSIFLSGLQVGGQAIQRTTSVPLQVATLIQTTITLFVSIKIFTGVKKRKLKSPDNKPPEEDVPVAPPTEGGQA